MSFSKARFISMREVEAYQEPTFLRSPRPYSVPRQIVGYEVGVTVFKFNRLATYDTLEGATAHCERIRDSYALNDPRRLYTFVRPIYAGDEN